MGCSYYANTVIGVSVDPDSLFTTQKVKAFEHDHPEDWEVDPKTGKKLWTTRDVPVEGVTFGYEGESARCNIGDDRCAAAGYDVVGGENDASAYIALCHWQTYSDGGRGDSTNGDMPSDEEIKAFKKELEEAGFSTADFGIHTFIRVSF